MKNMIVVIKKLTIKSTPRFFFFRRNNFHNNFNGFHSYSIRNVFQLLNHPHWTCLNSLWKLGVPVKLSECRKVSLSDIVLGIGCSLSSGPELNQGQLWLLVPWCIWQSKCKSFLKKITYYLVWNFLNN